MPKCKECGKEFKLKEGVTDIEKCAFCILKEFITKKYDYEGEAR